MKFPYTNALLEKVAAPELRYGSTVEPNQTIEKIQKVTIDANAEEGSEIWLKFDIYNKDIHYWTDSVLLIANSVGEKEYLSEAEIRIFPNPMQEYCRIHINGPVPIEKIEVYDLSGRLVFLETTIGTNSYQLIKGDLGKGMYILRVTAGRMYERKLVVR